jgi:HD superfamily phosphohydrolase
MIHQDAIYGPVEIKEELLIELINSKPMQRLKHVSQAGPYIFLSPNHKWKLYKTTRFEHSVGVFLLLKKFNASLEEQIAGLLHDTSHTVFSHSLDFLFNRNIQHDHHEKFKEKIIMQSEIPLLLKKNGIDVENILNEKKFGLMERELPDLCADRIDYFFRDGHLYNVTREELKTMLQSLAVYNNEFVFSHIDAARIFAERYIEANKIFWCNGLQATIFKLISDVVSAGINANILTEDDLFTTDDAVYGKLKNSDNITIKNLLATLWNIDVEEDKTNYDFHVKSKVRCTDPKVLVDGKTQRLSELDQDYKTKMEDFISEYSKGFFVRIRK